jgi:hypothetical protein
VVATLATNARVVLITAVKKLCSRHCPFPDWRGDQKEILVGNQVITISFFSSDFCFLLMSGSVAEQSLLFERSRVRISPHIPPNSSDKFNNFNEHLGGGGAGGGRGI